MLFFLISVLCVFLVIVFRWVNPPTSGVMIQRKVESFFSESSDVSSASPVIWASFNDISSYIMLAAIASEDQRFYQHGGFDLVQLKKAIKDKMNGKPLRGASTISQQTAKNLFLWTGRSYVRKGLEVWFTLLIEMFWSKDRILEVYLNIIEFGTGINGIQSASQVFFNKSANHISPNQAALLISVLPNPHKMKVETPSAYMYERQSWILSQMKQLGNIELLKKTQF